MAPALRAPIRAQAVLGRLLQYGYRSFALSQLVPVSDLNRVLLTNVNHTGSDIREPTGDILNPRAFPRQGVEADWWVWNPVCMVEFSRMKIALRISEECAEMFCCIAGAA